MRLGPELQKTSSLTLNISPRCTLEVKLQGKKKKEEKEKGEYLSVYTQQILISI